jgi:G3E family GTPase
VLHWLHLGLIESGGLQGTVLDAVLTVVDAKHITQHLDDKPPGGAINESVQQIAFADKILLNKLDLVTDAERLAVRERINVRSYNYCSLNFLQAHDMPVSM